MDFKKRLTFIVGPNGAGKSNVTRLLSICQRAVECSDGAADDIYRMLASFLAARHVFTQSPAVEARVGIQLTDPAERALVVEFVRALVTGAITNRRQVQNIIEIDAWAEAEITETRLLPLMAGEIVTRNDGTKGGDWECWYEFTAKGRDLADHKYRWYLLGSAAPAIIIDDEPSAGPGTDLATLITGSSAPSSGLTVPVPGSFSLVDLLPSPGQPVLGCAYEFLPQRASASQRRVALMAGPSPVNPEGNRVVTLARILRVILRSALRQTSDMRLLPSGGTSWNSSQTSLTDGAEARLPQLLAALKNGDPAQRAQYQRFRDLFTEFTQGRACDVRLTEVPQPSGPNGEPVPPAQVPAVWVTIRVPASPQDLAPEVPIEFAGAGAWEALVLASVLAEQAASVVVLDEPAIALHHSLQRRLAAHLEAAAAQFVVITHSEDLLPLGQDTDVQIVRLDRDDQGATRAWLVDDACRVKLSRKLAAKGNEGLPFASRAILGEGQDDQAAIHALCERMGIDVRRLNIMVVDCGSRDNLPDYIWFCAQIGLPYLAVMDGDASKPDARSKAQAVRDALKLHGGGELVDVRGHEKVPVCGRV